MKVSQKKTLQQITEELRTFDPQLIGFFVCPVCFSKISIEDDLSKEADDRLISIEHIKPKSAGGKIETFLCKECNNGFGSAQTKWFAKYSQMMKGDFHFLNSVESKKKPARKRFPLHDLKIDGEGRKGWVEVSPDGAVEVFDISPRPEIEKIRTEEVKPRHTINVEWKPYLADRDVDIRKGVLTAGYLLWFKYFGYSWVFQPHLNDVRSEISGSATPERRAAVVIDRFDQEEDSYWIGLARFGDSIHPVSAIEDKLLIFPSPESGQPPFEERVDSKIIGKVGEPVTAPNIFHRTLGPTFLVYENTPVVVPGRISDAMATPHCIQYCADGTTNILEAIDPSKSG